MPLRYDEKCNAVFDETKRISRSLGHFYVGVEHLALACIAVDPYLERSLSSSGIDIAMLKELVNETATPGDRDMSSQPETPRYKTLPKKAEQIAMSLKAIKIEPIHFFISVLEENKGVFCIALTEIGVNSTELSAALRTSFSGGNSPGQLNISVSPSSNPKAAEPQNNAKPSKEPKLLAKYARNLVDLAKSGKMDPIFGRNDEIRRVLQIISRKGKNNPVLIGEAGVGKTAVVFGLAQRLAEGTVPDMLKSKILLDLPMASLVAGAKHRGEFEERLQSIMKEVAENPDVIVFIDEIHTIVGAGDSKGGMDAGNILKPMLARGEFPVIGATTIDEYRKYIEADPALERRFQPVMVGEPSEEDTLLILNGLKNRYETHHGVKFEDKALLAAVKLSVRYLPDRNLPDKAIDLIDEAAAKIKMSSVMVAQGADFVVTEETIAEVISLWTGIPVSKLTSEEKERLVNLESYLTERVIGQSEAISTVSQTIRVIRMGLGNPNRPGGIFLFLGPTGVGKTELAKTLADFLFGSDKEMIRLDMSEFMEKHAIARLIGSPPGYVGHEEEGQLTSSVRTKPYSVVLLDEIEKAHPEVFDLFLQVFDDGRLTDSKGRTVNFTNTIIILTSNIGSSKVDSEGNSVLVDSKDPQVREGVMKELRKAFRPEFINRIDELILFNPLERDALDGIIQISLKEIYSRASERGINLTFDPSAIDLILSKGYNRAYGARPLKRAVQNYLTKPLAEKMLSFNEGEVHDLLAVAVPEEDRIEFVSKDGLPNEKPGINGTFFGGGETFAGGINEG